MTLRIGEFVIAGELRNTKRNSVLGWIEFAENFGIRIELTGNFPADWTDKHIRFETSQARESPIRQPEQLPEIIHGLADRQIGVLADCEWQPNPSHGTSDETLRLSFRWYSQNGEILVELNDPQVLSVSEDESSEAPSESQDSDGYAEVVFDENGIVSTSGLEQMETPEESDEDDGEPEDPFGLFRKDLDHLLAESLEFLGGEAGDDDDEAIGLPDWESTGSELDPETRAMYQHLDEIVQGDKDEPITYLFDKPLKLPKPDNVKSDQEAEQYVIAILAQLARLSVALDVCEHFSARDTYRLLIEEILPTAKVHPNLAESEMVQHFSTSDVCRDCEEEFEAQQRAESELPDDDDSTPENGTDDSSEGNE